MDEKSISNQLSEPSVDDDLADGAQSIVSSAASISVEAPSDDRQDPSVGPLSAPISIQPQHKRTSGFEQLDSPSIVVDAKYSSPLHKPDKKSFAATVADTLDPATKQTASPSLDRSSLKVITNTVPQHQGPETVGKFIVQSSPKSPLHSVLATSPAKLIHGSLLSQRLSGMPGVGGDGTRSPASQKNVQISPRDLCHGSPLSQRSYGSSVVQTPELYHQMRNSEIIGSMSSMSSSSTMQGKDGFPLNVLNGLDSPPQVNRNGKQTKSATSPKDKLKNLSTQTSEKSGNPTFRSLFGSIMWRSGSILSKHNLSTGGSSLIVNYVTEAQSVMPSLASAFSIDHVNELHHPGPVAMNIFDLESNQRSISHQDQLDHVDMLDLLEDSDYMDTVKSTDSAASLLRRSLSVPSRYHYKAPKRHIQDIFGQSPTDNIDPITGRVLIHRQASSTQQEKWRQTMDDLLEQPEYLDSLESSCSKTGLLASQARVLAQQQGYGVKVPSIGPSLSMEEQKRTNKQLKFIYFKNLIVLSLGFMFVFMAYLSLRNLQSSLYKNGGLGIIALCSVYASLFIGCIFATTVVQRLRPKRTMLMCIAGTFLYVATNFYPTYYTLVPASALMGFSLANMWTAHATYLASVATRYASLTNDKVQNVLSHFNGIFFAFFQSSQIIGGLISSTVLSQSNDPLLVDAPNNSSNYSMAFDMFDAMPYNTTGTSQAAVPILQCGAFYCSALADRSGDASTSVNQNLVFILVGIYMAFTIVGFIVITLCMDPLDGVMKKAHTSMLNQLTAVFRFFAQWKVACLFALMCYTLMQSSYMFGEYTKAFVSCTNGLYMVGYTMVCLSSCSAISAFVSGRIQRYMGRLSLFCSAFGVHAALLIVQILWKPEPEHAAIIFAISGCWGLADGIISTQTISLFGVIFADNKEPAFAGLKMCQALSATLLFATSEYMCTNIKLYILLIMLLFAVCGYLSMEFKLKELRVKPRVSFESTSV